jgi:ABC-type multidrug transport system fused ATPase/permease subunit
MCGLTPRCFRSLRSAAFLKFILPASIAIAQRFVIDRLVPTLQTQHEQTDFSYRGTISYLEWASTQLPARWGTNTPWGQLNILMFTLIVIYALWGVSFYLRSYLAALAGHRVILDLRADLYTHITRMSHSFFQSHQSGGIVSRLMADIALAQNFRGHCHDQHLDGHGDVRVLHLPFVQHGQATGLGESGRFSVLFAGDARLRWRGQAHH